MAGVDLSGSKESKADEDVIYERVTRVMKEIQRAQIEIVGLVAHKRITVE